MTTKAANTGAFTIPTAPSVGTSITSGAANTYSAAYVQLIASTSAAIFITHIMVNFHGTNKPDYINVQLATGDSGSETIVGQIQLPYTYTSGTSGAQESSQVALVPWIAVATSTRIAAKIADATGSLAWTVVLQCINQANVVDAGITETSNAAQFGGQTVTAAAGVTVPSSLASPTNITAGTITTVTNLTNAPSNGDFTSTMKTSLNSATPAVTVSDKTGFSLSSAGLQAIWDKLTSALTTVGSVGKLLVDNIDAAISSRSTYAGGDTSGTTTLLSRLTSTRASNLDDLDATISSRLASASYTAPDNSSITSIKTKTDQLHFTVANQVDANALTGGSAGTGSVSTVLTINVSGLPKDGVKVWATTDSAGDNVVASGTTDAFGHVTFQLDPGTYYCFKQLAGYNFTNPESFTVP